MKRLIVILGVMFGCLAFAGFQGYNGTTDLKVFSKIRCSTGLTCTRVNDKFSIVSSPTISTGTFTVSGDEGSAATINIYADEGDDATDKFSLNVTSTDQLQIKNNTTVLYSISSTGILTLTDTNQTLTTAAGVATFESSNDAESIKVVGNEASNALITLQADQSDDSGDDWEIKNTASTDSLTISNDVSGSQVAKMTIDTTGNVTGPGTGYIAGYLSNVVTGAQGSTLTAAQCGNVMVASAAGTVNLPTLSSSLIGCRYTIASSGAFTVDINPDNSSTILPLTNANGDAIRAGTTNGSTIVVVAVSASAWAPVGYSGTAAGWTDVN